ncbi:MAG: dockerin type I repeat-containing protein, partial [Xanthomonadales bacterium]|nr:dockerin type I repeat-containing protein [Xanthomonadales bacterium]
MTRFLPALCRLAGLAGVLTLQCYPVSAVAQGCLDTASLSPWLHTISSNFVNGGAESSGANAYVMCSSADGPGDSLDSIRMLLQSASGDFSLDVSLDELTSRGSGGLAVTIPGLDLANAPRLLIWVEANHPDASTGELHTSIRRADDGLAEPGPAPVEVELPVRLWTNREDGVLSAGFIDSMDNPVAHLSADVSGGLLGGQLRVGMLQFAGNGNQDRFAHFSNPQLLEPEAPGLECTEGDPLLGAQAMLVRGTRMDAVNEVRAFGNRAAILEQTTHHLLIQPAAPVGGVNYGSLEIFSDASRHPQTTEIAAIGQPFARGDVNLDGQVDGLDLEALQAWFSDGIRPKCPGAADVNGDSFTDTVDLGALDAWLNGRGRPPAAPFPEPGFVPGAQTCGTEGPPNIRSMRAAKLARKRPLREGDEIVVRGNPLPEIDELVVWFGNVRMRVVGSRNNSMTLRVGHVPSTGHRCARVIDVASRQANGAARLGGGWLAPDDSPQFCFDFEASAPDEPVWASHVNADGRIEISIPRDEWQPGRKYEIRASAFMPWLDGVSRGSRDVRLTFLAPNAGGRDALGNYELGLNALAQKMTTAMNGDYLAETPCDCELEVEAQPGLEKMILAPCYPPPPKPEPVADGPNQWQAPPPDIVGGIQILPNNPPPVECDGEFVSHKDDPRRAAWCHFQHAVQTVDEETLVEPVPDYLGHPLFATWQPRNAVVSVPPFEPWIIDPDSQPLLMKHYLFEDEAEDDLNLMGYDHPHIWALRRTHCQNFKGDWMPKINFGRRVAKTFFIAHSMLPSSVSTNGLYSYVPPCPENQPNCDNEEHYLVGLHLGISTLHDFGQSEGYFWWATFWVPAAINDTQTKGGQDLQWTYSQECVVGNGVDRPL